MHATHDHFVTAVAETAAARTQRFKDPGDRILLVGARRPETEGSLYRDAGFADAA